ncbi:TPA: DUF551 domain-containing protein [Klebsiella pneumoniae]|nr:DUF551 domain-containing protein [Klebsiella pneumoniae]HBT3269775.1 DUF551 domain-containing protein [Klebsiella pneumoniae]
MTKSTITREESIQAVFNLKVGYKLGLADIEILKRVARMALAAMESEPVAIIDQANLDYLRSGADADVWPPEREEMGDVLLYRHAQPAPVVPEEKPIPNTLSMYAVDAVAAIAEVKGWNACRAAMLQELKKSAGTEAICRSDENVQVLHANPPAIPDGYVMVPDDLKEAAADLLATLDDYPEQLVPINRDSSVVRALRAAMLAAAPQSPGSDPATVPGKWIPVSEQMPEDDGAYLCWDNRYVTTHAFIFGAWQANQFIAKNITHWMPLPAAPQEVSDA